MTKNEIFRTAHKYLSPREYSYGDGKTHGINEICRICKSDATAIGKNDEEHKDYEDFYKTLDYKAYRCNACGYVFSWYKDKAI